MDIIQIIGLIIAIAGVFLPWTATMFGGAVGFLLFITGFLDMAAFPKFLIGIALAAVYFVVVFFAQAAFLSYLNKKGI